VFWLKPVFGKPPLPIYLFIIIIIIIIIYLFFIIIIFIKLLLKREKNFFLLLFLLPIGNFGKDIVYFIVEKRKRKY
jgi:ABC-type multidrug transport system permease subunit